MAQPLRPYAAKSERGLLHHYFNIQYCGPGGATCSLKVKVEQKLVCLRPNIRLHPHIHGVSFLTFADILEGFHLKPAAHIIDLCCAHTQFEFIRDIECKISDIIDRKATNPVLYIKLSKRWISDIDREMRSIAGEVEKALEHAYASYEEALEQVKDIRLKCDTVWRRAKRVDHCFECLLALHVPSTIHGRELRSMHNHAVECSNTLFSQWSDRLWCNFWSLDVVQRVFRRWPANDVSAWLRFTSDFAEVGDLAEVSDSNLRDAGVDDAETRKLILDRIQSLIDEYGGDEEEDAVEEGDVVEDEDEGDEDGDEEEEDQDGSDTEDEDDEYGNEEEEDAGEESSGAASQNEQFDDEDEDEKAQEDNSSSQGRIQSLLDEYGSESDDEVEEDDEDVFQDEDEDDEYGDEDENTVESSGAASQSEQVDEDEDEDDDEEENQEDYSQSQEEPDLVELHFELEIDHPHAFEQQADQVITSCITDDVIIDGVDEEDDAEDDENDDEEEEDVEESRGAESQSEQLDDKKEDEKVQEENRPRTFRVGAFRVPAAGLKTEQELKDLLRDITSKADPSHCREFTLLVIHIDDFHAFRTRELMTSLCGVLGGLLKKEEKEPGYWHRRDIKELHAFYRGDNQFAIVARHPSGDKARASLQSLYDVVKREIRQLRPPTRNKDTREGPLNASIEISAGAFVGDYNKKAANGDGWLAWAIDAVRKVKSLKIEALSEKMKSLELKIALCDGDAATKAKALDGRYQSAMKDPRTRWGSQVVSSLCIRDSTQSNDFRFYPTNRK